MMYTAVFTAVSTMSRAALCALLGLCLLAGLLPKAGAAAPLPTFTVTRTADDLNPGSLRSAIAQAAAGGGTVVFNIPTTDPGVSSGTATITLLLGPLVVPSSLSIVGPNMPSGAIVVSGGTGDSPSRIFSVTGGTVAFSNLTIQHGVAAQFAQPYTEPDGGGGILNTASLTLTGCTVTDNISYSTVGGGGINNSGAGASLTLNNCTVSLNPGYSGGGGILNSGTLVLNSTLIADNSTAGFGNGGGLLNTGLATLNNCTLSDNQASSGVSPLGNGGGGAYNTGTLTLNSCLVDDNSTQTGSGGGINNGTGGLLVLSACTLSRNSAIQNAGGTGGGVSNAGAAQITDCLIVENSGFQVGGLDNGGALTLINSTFSGNVNEGNNAPGNFTGGLRSGPATLLNDIFYFDISYATGAPLPSEIIAAPGTAGPTVTYSDVQGGYPGTGNLNADPQFVRSPVFNVNPAHSDPGDEHLLVTSPAVHTGTSGPGVPLTDIEGTPRPTPPAFPSLGAYEVSLPPVLASLSLPASVEGGSVVTATVTLSEITASNVVVGLSSSNPSVVRINRGVIIPAGSSSATFAIDTYRSHGTQTVTIQATSGQVVQTANLTITGR